MGSIEKKSILLPLLSGNCFLALLQQLSERGQRGNISIEPLGNGEQGMTEPMQRKGIAFQCVAMATTSINVKDIHISICELGIAYTTLPAKGQTRISLYRKTVFAEYSLYCTW